MSRDGLAPVVELAWKRQDQAAQHVVLRGETLYAIAFRYDKDYRQLAAINRLSAPFTLRVGQVLRLRQGGASSWVPTHSTTAYRRKPASSSSSWSRPVSPQVAYPVRSYGTTSWFWPARGRLSAAYAPQQGQKGINIAGKKGDKIYAAAAGVVAYSGSGLAGYGNLIIMKHDNQYLTAYGNNLNNLVHEGQHVRVGQVIATMGVVDRSYWGLHFEIRQAGQPVNPLNYLPRR